MAMNMEPKNINLQAVFQITKITIYLDLSETRLIGMYPATIIL